MQIDAIYIAIFAAGLLVGLVLGWVIAAGHYRTAWFRRALLAKNPELWDLVHFVLRDEEEEKTGKHRRAVQASPPKRT